MTGLRGENVVSTLGSVGKVTPSRLAEAKEEWTPRFADLPRPLMAVLVGGDTKRKKASEADWLKFAEGLSALAAKSGMVITTSRRTGAFAETCLRAALPDAMIWDGEGENPYFGMLACVDMIVVTDDSVNMASEAAAAGKPLAIYPLLQEGGKTARFHETLIERGHAAWFDGSVPTACAGSLNETERAAKQIAAMMLPAEG